MWLSAFGVPHHYDVLQLLADDSRAQPACLPLHFQHDFAQNFVESCRGMKSRFQATVTACTLCDILSILLRYHDNHRSAFVAPSDCACENTKKEMLLYFRTLSCPVAEFKAKDIGLRAQKKLLSHVSNKSVAKVFIDDTAGSLLDNVYRLVKNITGSKKDAEKITKNIIKVYITIQSFGADRMVKRRASW